MELLLFIADRTKPGGLARAHFSGTVFTDPAPEVNILSFCPEITDPANDHGRFGLNVRPDVRQQAFPQKLTRMEY
jgi:hypothetical protein